MGYRLVGNKYNDLLRKKRMYGVRSRKEDIFIVLGEKVLL